MEIGLRDPVMPFIKKEPHPKRKLDEGRYRVITAISVVDQVVERMLFSRLVDSYKDLYPEGACAIGIGFTEEHAGMFARTVQRSAATHGGLVSGDISGWDGSVSVEMMQDAIEVFAAQCDERHRQWWRRAAMLWVALSCSCTYALSG